MKNDAARRLGLLAIAAGLGVALAAVARRRVRSGTREDPVYRCECGAEYRVQGVDRHRIYWRDGAPVLGDRCAACDAPLPVGHDGAVV